MITNVFWAQKITKMKGILLKCSKKASEDLKTGNTLVIASWGYIRIFGTTTVAKYTNVIIYDDIYDISKDMIAGKLWIQETRQC